MADNQKNNQQDPLAALEDILKNAQTQAGGQKQPANADDTAGEEELPPIELTEEEKAALAREEETRNQALEEKKQAEINQFRQQMKEEINKTDAYQARVAQDEEDKKQKNDDDQGSFDIHQLEHKKI